MDVQMPMVDGWTLTREIKGNERTQQTRVLIISASVGEGFRRAADLAGADALLAKPCDPQRIVVELTRLLDCPAPVI
jgi:CheY-like chemotaxis protein